MVPSSSSDYFHDFRVAVVDLDVAHFGEVVDLLGFYLKHFVNFRDDCHFDLAVDYIENLSYFF